MAFASMAGSAADDRVLAAYQPLLQQNVGAIKASWERCQSAGLKRADRPLARAISRAELRDRYESVARVRELALNDMRLLHGHLGHRGFTLTLADSSSVILDCLPGSGPEAAGGPDLAPGHCWPETERGTNAVGTAAAAGRLVVVAGDDHYLQTYRGLLCVATPIFAADGSVRAVLDATAARSVDSHTLAYTLGLMHMAGGHVQAELFRREHADDYVVLLDAQAGLSGVALAFDDSGRLTGRSAGAITALSDLAVNHQSVHFETLFDADFERLRVGIRPPCGFASLTDKLGRAYQATFYVPERRPEAEPKTVPATRAGRFSGKEPRPDLGDDGRVRKAAEMAERALAYQAPILVHGETGTGKEWMARYIHAASGRSGEFVAVNCSALPESLIEAELFGHVAGAFTGARRGGADGLIRRADGGTLFLDEIGDMPILLQARLLRFIDTWQVRPVGSEIATVVDVQLVTATHRDLDAEVAAERFRLDLLHRIKVCGIQLPPLRERSDFPRLCRRVLDRIEPDRILTDEAIDRLAEYDWPGNIRELHNVLLQTVIETGQSRIDPAALTSTIAGGTTCGQRGAVRSPETDWQTVLAEENGNIAATARRLGISRTTIYNRMRRRGW